MKRGCPSHPKTLDLAERLGITRYAAVGLLELLFHFGAQYAPQGDIGKFTNKRIAAGLFWGGSPEKLIGSLELSGWLDKHTTARLVIHDWSSHLDRTTSQRLTRLGKKPIDSNDEDTGNLCTQSETHGFNNESLPEPEPIPEPEPEPKPPQDDLWFAEAWGHCWRKEDKADSQKAYRKYVKSQSTHEAVVRRMKLYAPIYLQRERERRPLLASWFGKQRHLEDPPDSDQPALFPVENARPIKVMT